MSDWLTIKEIKALANNPKLREWKPCKNPECTEFILNLPDRDYCSENCQEEHSRLRRARK